MPKLLSMNGTPSHMQTNSPVWLGPCSDVAQGGITQSLVGRWLVCRERFRLHTMEGLCGRERFSHRLEYGTMFHLAEEHCLAGKDWKAAVSIYADELCDKYPFDRDDVMKWRGVCLTQFPIYTAYWSRLPDAGKRQSLLQEYEFHVPYTLPSGRVVYLRGKWDAIELDGGGIWCVDHKTKSEIDQVKIARQMQMDMQTMTYLVALYDACRQCSVAELKTVLDLQGYNIIRGVRYNLIMRPLSSEDRIVQKKGSKNVPAETFAEFMGRLAERIHEKADRYFIRFNVEVTASEIDHFRNECLDPILENICDDYEWWAHCYDLYVSPFSQSVVNRAEEFPHHTPRHYRMPFGAVPLEFRTDLDEYLATGSDIGLRRVTNLFPELKGVKEESQSNGVVITNHQPVVAGGEGNAGNH